MTDLYRPARRPFVLTTVLAGAAFALLFASALTVVAAEAAVTFNPARVPQGGSVNVKAGPAGKVRSVFLSQKKTIQPGYVTLGTIAAGKAKARLKVPRTAKPGRYFVIACSENGCKASKKKLTVLAARGNGKKKDKRVFRLRYVHTDSASHTNHEEGPFTGTVTWNQNMALRSAVKVKNGKGAGPIRYTRAKYMRKQVGEFSTDSASTCTGTSTSTLTGTKNGTARVLRLKVKGRRIALDFRPGPVLQSRGVPAENIRAVSIFEAVCADADYTSWNRIFLNDFGNFYQARRQLQQTTGPNPFFARLNKGWKVRPNRKKGFAKLVVKGKLYTALTYRDTYIIDRLH